MLADKLRATAHKLIDKFGNSMVLNEIVEGGYDVIAGENTKIVTPHNVIGVISPYSTSEILEGVIDINDAKVLLYADNYLIDKGWTLEFDTDVFEIMNVSQTTAQNKKIVYELQCRSRNA